MKKKKNSITTVNNIPKARKHRGLEDIRTFRLILRITFFYFYEGTTNLQRNIILKT